MATVYTDVEIEKSAPEYDNPAEESTLYELAVSENPLYATAVKPVRGHRRMESLIYPATNDMRHAQLYDDRTVVEQGPAKVLEFGAATSTDDPDYLQTS